MGTGLGIMTTEKTSAFSVYGEKAVRALVGWLASVAAAIAPPVLRIALALPFFRTGLTRWDGFLALSQSTLYLFEDEFKLHVRAALTRNNFLFAGSDAGGDRAAIAFTILSCCRLVGVNPIDYLGDVLPRLARRVRIRELSALLPASWKAARAES